MYKIIFILIAFSFNMFAQVNRDMNAVVMMQGPAALAAGNDISSIYLNPALLTRIVYSEILVNFDAVYTFNYLALGHYFRGFGNVGFGLFRDVALQEDKIALGYGAKVWKKQNKKTRNELSLGFNAVHITKEDVTSYSFNPGLLYAVRKDKGSFRGFYTGLSTSELFHASSNLSISVASSLHFVFPVSHAFMLSVGMSYSPILEKSLYSGCMELQLNRIVFTSLGVMTGALNFGLSFKNINDFLYLACRISPQGEQEVQATVMYRRMILRPKKDLPMVKKTVKPNSISSKQTKKTPTSDVTKNQSKVKERVQKEITESLLSEQQELLRSGLDLYTAELYAKAIEVWKKVIELHPDTEYAHQAEGYIIVVEKEIKAMTSK